MCRILVGHADAVYEPSNAQASVLCCDEDVISEIDIDECEDQREAKWDRPCGGQNPSASSHVTASQRATGVDGMIAAAASLGLCNDALFLGVACLDRYLAVVQITPLLLQPLSIACLWVAAKYECAVNPRAGVFASLMVDAAGYSLGDAATAVKLLVMLEAGVLRTLDFRLAAIFTAKHHKHVIFQNLWSGQATAAAAVAVAGMDLAQQQQLYSMTSYLIEVSLMEWQLLPCPQSQVAAAAYTLAHVLLGMHLDYDLLVMVTGYTFQQLHSTLQMLCALHTTLSQAMDNGKPYAVSVKYSSPAVNHVARVAPLKTTDDPRLAA